MNEPIPYFIKFQIISLFVGIWALLLGIWTLSYVYQNYKRYKRDLLKWLFYYILLMNISVLIFQVAGYLQLVQSETSFFLLLSRYAFAVVISSLAVVGSLYFLIRVVVKLNSLTLPKFLKQVFAGLFFIFLCSYSIGFYLFFHSDTGQWLKVTDIAVDVFAWMAVFIILIYFTFMAPKEKKPIHRKASVSFFYFYLIFYVIWSLSVLPPEPIRHYLVFVTYIIFNLIPLIWIPKYYLKFVVSPSEEKNLTSTAGFINKYNITQREQEIIHLVLGGKNNEKIAEILFISPSTVRNHIYRIYQKLNVKNRLQLARKILEERQ
jgi:DNA-binding CsgD family transcriptional regulator